MYDYEKDVNDEALLQGFKTIKSGGLFSNVEIELEMINIDKEDSAEVQAGLVRTYLDSIHDKSDFNFTTKTRHYNVVLNHSHTLETPFGDFELTRQDLIIDKITDVIAVGMMMIKMQV